MSTRLLIGLSVGSGFEAADAAAVRIDGTGLGMTPRPAAAARVTLPVDLRETGRRLVRCPDPWPAEFPRRLADVLGMAARQVVMRAGAEFRSVFAAGWVSRLPVGGPSADPDRTPTTPADWLAEQTGLTLVTGFRERDAAAGGSGQLLTTAADSLLFRAADEERLLIHLGSATSVVLLPPGGKLSAVAGFECGPGNRLLDELTGLGTRGKEACDHGGTRAVQGHHSDELLARWLTHPYLTRKPPKAVPASAFGPTFVADGFEAARVLGLTLNDLLCTATHFVARCVGGGCRKWLPAAAAPRRVLVSGGGARNGFLWKLLEAEFGGTPLERLDALGTPAHGRTSAAAAVLAALTLDGVAGNLPLLTGAAGGRLVGRIVPGDMRNWAACAGWMGDQTADYRTWRRAG